MIADLKKDDVLVRFQWRDSSDWISVFTINASGQMNEHWPIKRMTKDRARVRWKFMLASGYKRILPDSRLDKAKFQKQGF